MSVMTVEHGLAPGPKQPLKMPEGIAFSAILHIGLFVLIVLGLPQLFRARPPEEQPIAVNLVTIAPETKATQPNPFRPKPDAKPDQAVAPPAPKPEPKPEPPTPVPEPPASAASPAAAPPPPKPEAKPEAPPPPPPPPKPVEAHAPPQPPQPKPEPRKSDAAAFDKLVKNLEHQKPDPAAFDKLMKNLEEKKPNPADFDALLKNLTRQQTAEAPDAPPQPHRVAATAPPSSQPKAPLGSQLSSSEIDLVRERLRPCFNPPFGAKEKPDLAAEIRVVMNRDGTVQQTRVADTGQYASDQVYRALADAGIRALRDSRCSPLPLPADRYDVWQTIVFPFSIRDMQ